MQSAVYGMTKWRLFSTGSLGSCAGIQAEAAKSKDQQLHDSATKLLDDPDAHPLAKVCGLFPHPEDAMRRPVSIGHTRILHGADAYPDKDLAWSGQIFVDGSCDNPRVK